MRRAIFTGILFAFVLVGSAYAGSGEADGFSGLKWGTGFSEVKDEMTYVYTSAAYGGIRFYTRKNDELKVGSAQVECIKYGFWHDKFVSVDVSVLGHNDFNGLKDTIFQKFGEGHELKQVREFYTWTGKRTNMVLEYGNRAPGVGYLMILSADTFNEYAKAPARDF